VAAGLAILLPVLAVGTYQRLGDPNPPAPRPAQAANAAVGELGSMIERLAARLKEQPDDLDGWMLLGRSYLQSGRPADAVAAYTRALNLAPKDPDVQVAFGEALVFAADGIVTPPARSAFAQALTANPSQAGARYYLGLAEVQAGRKQQGYEAWLSLARDTPADAPWAALIKRQIAQLGAELGRDPAKDIPQQLAADAPAPSPASAQTVPSQPRGPTQEDMKAASEMKPEDRAAFIRSMVDGLAARLKEKPDDPDGWIRLARAYGVLGEKQKQRDAYAKLAELRPNDPGALLQAARAIVQAEMKPGAGPPAQAVAIYRKLLALEPSHGEALWFTGLGAAYAGDKQAAASAFEKLLAQMDPKSPEYGQVKAQLDKVKAGG
jgi:cytochrome c-type biogenesis protein CcmH